MTTQPPSFADLGVGEPMINVLAARGVVTPFPIQAQTLPDTLAGRDALGRGKTGSGKTLLAKTPADPNLTIEQRLGPERTPILFPAALS